MGSSLSQFGFGQTYVNNKQAIKGDPQDPTQGDMVKGKSGWSKQRNNEQNRRRHAMGGQTIVESAQPGVCGNKTNEKQLL